MERTTKEITLPESKAIVVLYSFLTGGDKRAIKKKMFGAMTMTFEGEKTKVNDMTGDVIIDQEEFALSLLIISIKEANETPVTDIKTFIYNLSEKDSDFLYDTVNEVTKDSSLSAEDKKK